MIIFGLNFLLMSGAAGMYFLEKKSAFAQFYIGLASSIGKQNDDSGDAKTAITALWTNSRFAL